LKIVPATTGLAPLNSHTATIVAIAKIRAAETVEMIRCSNQGAEAGAKHGMRDALQLFY
jgi:hypothetical protein